MPGDAALSAAILLFALVLFVSEKVRHDLIAVATLLACLITGLVTPDQALLGFADPAVIAVAAVLIVGRAVELTGIAAALMRALVPARATFAIRLATLMAVAALLSAFMNNIAALVITMPLATEIARRTKLPPGAVLMPLAFATILGGMTTLIGTPANLILSSIREEQLGEPFSFFAMTPVGVAVTAIGLVYLATIGWRLVPRRSGSARGVDPWRVFELAWPARRRAGQVPLQTVLRSAGARLLGVFRQGAALAPHMRIRPGDRLLLLSRCNQWDVAEQAGLAPTVAKGAATDAETARVVVAHGSFLVGQGYESVHLRSEGRIDVVAGGPRAARLRQPLDRLRIEAGDQLYVRGPAVALAAFLPRARLLEIDRFDPAPPDWIRACVTVAIFVAAIATTVSGLAPPALSFFGAAALVAALRLIPTEEIYRSIDWPVIVLLAAMIPVGGAFESSGAADLVAAWLGNALSGTPVFVALAALCGATLLLSIFLNNVATAVIMGPIAVHSATLLGIDPDAALLAVLIGASSDFLTPIGHQNNLLVMGPGGYRFTDYARVGTALAALTILTAAAVLAAKSGV